MLNNFHIKYIYLKIFLDKDIHSFENYFDGRGPIDNLLLTLIIKLLNFLMPKIETLRSIINSYELRLKSYLLKLLVLIIQSFFKTINKI